MFLASGLFGVVFKMKIEASLDLLNPHICIYLRELE